MKRFRGTQKTQQRRLVPEEAWRGERISVRRVVGAAVTISHELAYIPGQRRSDTQSGSG